MSKEDLNEGIKVAACIVRLSWGVLGLVIYIGEFLEWTTFEVWCMPAIIFLLFWSVKLTPTQGEGG